MKARLASDMPTLVQSSGKPFRRSSSTGVSRRSRPFGSTTCLNLEGLLPPSPVRMVREGWSIGSGDQVSANVQFFPWSTNAASTTFQACTITGTNAPETLNGTNGSDIICGKGGNDTINGLDGNDLLIGDGGDDTLVGGQGNDAILGTSGNDTLKGGAGLDSLQGGDGTDTCSDPNPFHFATCESGP